MIWALKIKVIVYEIFVIDCVQIRRDVLAFGLAKTFADANHVIIVSMLSLVEFPVRSVLLRIFLETNFSDRLAKTSSGRSHRSALSVYFNIS